MRHATLTPTIALACLALQAVPALAVLSAPGAQPLRGEDLVRRAQIAVDLAGAPLATAVVFLSARCPCSASHEETLKRLAREFPRIRFVAVHSNADEGLEESRAHFEAAQLPFPVIQDPGASIANRFGALKTPHVFLLDARGEIVFRGGIDDSHVAAAASRHYLEDAIRDLQSGKKPEVAEVRVLGCVIQRP